MSVPSPALPMGFLPQPASVLIDVAAFDRKTVLQDAAKGIAHTHALDDKLVFDALWRREQAASTALGHGFAVPHARIAGIEEPLTMYLRTRKPIDFGAPDGLPVSHLLVILVPVDGDHEDHLRLLASVAGLISDRAFRERLSHANSPGEATSVFAAGIERRHAVE